MHISLFEVQTLADCWQQRECGCPAVSYITYYIFMCVGGSVLILICQSVQMLSCPSLLLHKQPICIHTLAWFQSTPINIMGFFAFLVVICATTVAYCNGFQPQSSRLHFRRKSVIIPQMSLDVHTMQHMIHDMPTWAQFAAQGIADAAVVPTATVTPDRIR